MKLRWLFNGELLFRWWVRKDVAAARHAIDRYYGVPYFEELSEQEARGMVVLERRGELIRDYGFTGIHWHRRP